MRVSFVGMVGTYAINVSSVILGMLYWCECINYVFSCNWMERVRGHGLGCISPLSIIIL